MSQEYPWYGIVTGKCLEQGQFYPSCTVTLPTIDFVDPQEAAKRKTLDWRTYDVVLMSQSCDLQHDKLDLVLVCPHCSLEKFGKANPFFAGVDGKEALRKGNAHGFHMLAACDLDGWVRDIQVVDFRTVFSVPIQFMRGLATRTDRRLQLLPPYREHLSQAFARFFMRVGLPLDIPKFMK